MFGHQLPYTSDFTPHLSLLHRQSKRSTHRPHPSSVCSTCYRRCGGGCGTVTMRCQKRTASTSWWFSRNWSMQSHQWSWRLPSTKTSRTPSWSHTQSFYNIWLQSTSAEKSGPSVYVQTFQPGGTTQTTMWKAPWGFWRTRSFTGRDWRFYSEQWNEKISLKELISSEAYNVNTQLWLRFS